MTGTADPKALVRRLYDEALNQARYDEVVEEVVAADTVTHDGLGRTANGPPGVKATMRALHAAFSDLVFTIDDILNDNDRVAVRWHMTGRHTGPFAGHTATGKTVTQRAVVLYRIADGRVAEVWPLTDRLGLLLQIDNAPHPGALTNTETTRSGPAERVPGGPPPTGP